MIIAIDAGPVAAPAIAATTRNAISDGASHANAVAAVAIANPDRPSRYTRRWPWTSPIFPSTGIASASARNGPVIAKVRIDADASRLVGDLGQRDREDRDREAGREHTGEHHREQEPRRPVAGPAAPAAGPATTTGQANVGSSPTKSTSSSSSRSASPASVVPTASASSGRCTGPPSSGDGAWTRPRSYAGTDGLQEEGDLRALLHLGPGAGIGGPHRLARTVVLHVRGRGPGPGAAGSRPRPSCRRRLGHRHQLGALAHVHRDRRRPWPPPARPPGSVPTTLPGFDGVAEHVGARDAEALRPAGSPRLRRRSCRRRRRAPAPAPGRRSP